MIRNLNSINILIIAFAINLYFVITLSPVQFDPGIFMDAGTMSVLTMILILTVWILCLFHFIINSAIKYVNANSKYVTIAA